MLAANFNGVLKSPGGHKGYPGSFALQQSIGANRSAVYDQNISAGRGDLGYGLSNGLGWVSRRGKDFQYLEGGLLQPDAIRKCSPAINRNF